jgi:hypothetical protein
VTLTATGTLPSVFGRWQGDTTTTNSVLVLRMGRPFSVTAVFDAPLAITPRGALATGEVGNPYTQSFQVSGGSGSYSWSLVRGELPAGLVLKVNGQITGTPQAIATGTSVFTLRVSSGQQQVLLLDSISVSAPTLVPSAVLSQLVTGTSNLGPSDLAYLDFIGNGNGRFDVGDFLAWVRLTGATPTSPAAQRTLAAVPRGQRP